jgi:hypothetical protein
MKDERLNDLTLVCEKDLTDNIYLEIVVDLEIDLEMLNMALLVIPIEKE